MFSKPVHAVRAWGGPPGIQTMAFSKPNLAATSLVTQALSRRGKSLATLGGQSHLLPLRHGSCDLQRPHLIFENYRDFCDGTWYAFFKRFSKDREKQQRVAIHR